MHAYVYLMYIYLLSLHLLHIYLSVLGTIGHRLPRGDWGLLPPSGPPLTAPSPAAAVGGSLVAAAAN